MERVCLKAAAKLNFSLDILGKRPDGYHEMDMVMRKPFSLRRGSPAAFPSG